MHLPQTRVTALVSLILAAIVIAGCGGTAATASIQKVDPSKAVGMLDSSVVVDVRTPAEFAAGHLADAQNFDVEAADFDSRVSSLDKTAQYVVYCHSGRRSAIAATKMAAAGFTDIVDGGAMADLVAAGAPTR